MGKGQHRAIRVLFITLLVLELAYIGLLKWGTRNIDYRGDRFNDGNIPKERRTRLGGGYSKDSVNIYYYVMAKCTDEDCLRIVARADPQTFRVLGDDGYARDGHAVYFRGLRVPAADPQTFRYVPYQRGVDKRCFFMELAAYRISHIPDFDPDTFRGDPSPGLYRDKKNIYKITKGYNFNTGELGEMSVVGEIEQLPDRPGREQP